MAGPPESLGFSPLLDAGSVAGTEGRTSVPATSPEDFRVRCTSKRAVTEVVELCGRFVQLLGDALPEEIREPALRDVQWTFESAVQENVSINGQAWQEASDTFMDSDIKELEDQFDEIIVDIATKRKQYPRKILECVIKTIKAKQEILKQYHPVVPPLDLKCDLDPGMLLCNSRLSFMPSVTPLESSASQTSFITPACSIQARESHEIRRRERKDSVASRMENLKCTGETVAKQISEAMKSLPALIEQGDGFSQVLKMQPIIHLQRIHQEVFSSSGKPDVKPESSITQRETTPTETSNRKTTDVVLKRKQTKDCPQREWYPLRPKRVNLAT